MTVGIYCIPVYGNSADLLLDQFSASACLIDMHGVGGGGA